MNTYLFSTPKPLDFSVEYYFHEKRNIIPAKNFPPHVADTVEFYILLEGDVSFSVENNLYKLSEGDVIVSKPNQVHNCILNSNSVHKHLCFWFKPTPAFIFEKFLNLNSNLISPLAVDKEKLLSLYAELKTASEESNGLKQYALMVRIIEILSKHVDEGVQEQQVAPPILKDILDDLNSSFTEINSISYFTKKYSISSSTLNRLFKIHLNTSPKLYLETKRLAYARILLKNGETVMGACMKAGFPDYSNFIRLFKKRFNTTPHRYKNDK